MSLAACRQNWGDMCMTTTSARCLERRRFFSFVETPIPSAHRILLLLLAKIYQAKNPPKRTGQAPPTLQWKSYRPTTGRVTSTRRFGNGSSPARKWYGWSIRRSKP